MVTVFTLYPGTLYPVSTVWKKNYLPSCNPYGGERGSRVGCSDDEVLPRVDVHQIGFDVVVELVVPDLVGHLQDPAQYVAVGYDDLSAEVHFTLFSHRTMHYSLLSTSTEIGNG